MKVSTRYDIAMLCTLGGFAGALLCACQVSPWLGAAFVCAVVMAAGVIEATDLDRIHGQDVCLGRKPEAPKSEEWRPPA